MEEKTFGQALDNRYVNEGDGGGGTGLGSATFEVEIDTTVNPNFYNIKSAKTEGLTPYEEAITKGNNLFQENILLTIRMFNGDKSAYASAISIHLYERLNPEQQGDSEADEAIAPIKGMGLDELGIKEIYRTRIDGTWGEWVASSQSV